MQMQGYSLSAAALAVATLISLSACDQRNDDRTVGQKVDSAIATAEQKTDRAAAELKKDTAQARDSTGKAVDAVGSKMKDAAITTGINAELARDSTLSAMKIDVDTNGGKVAMHGTAPDAAARDRATQLAKKVDGVVSVDNQLQIGK